MTRPGYVRLPGFRTVLPLDIEAELVSHVKSIMKTQFSRLTYLELGTLAYAMAEKHGINHCFNKERKRAGADWVRGFLKRNPCFDQRLATYTPEDLNQRNEKQFHSACNTSSTLQDINEPKWNVENTVPLHPDNVTASMLSLQALDEEKNLTTDLSFMPGECSWCW